MKLIKNIVWMNLLLFISYSLFSFEDVSEKLFQELFKNKYQGISQKELDFKIEQQLFGRLSLSSDVYKAMFKYNELPLDQKLLLAVTQNDIETVKELLPQFSRDDLNTPVASGCTFLYEAVFRGFIDIVKLLIESGANVNVKAAVGMEQANYPQVTPHTLLYLCIVAPTIYTNSLGSLEEGDAILYFVQRYLKIAEYLIISGADLSLEYSFLENSQDKHEGVRFVQLIDKWIGFFKKNRANNKANRGLDEYYQKIKHKSYDITLQYLKQLKSILKALKVSRVTK